MQRKSMAGVICTPSGTCQAVLPLINEHQYWIRNEDRIPKLTTHRCSEGIRALISLGVTSLCQSGTIIEQHPVARLLMRRPANRQATLMETVVMAMPMVNEADPQKRVCFRPSLSARKRPVSGLPTKAPARMNAAMSP